MDREQKVLEKMNKADRWFDKGVKVFAFILMLFFLGMAVYYGICWLRGMDSGKQFLASLEAFFGLAAALICVKLFFIILDKYHQSDYNFDPQSMVLPGKGTVTLEGALHRMAVKTGVIIWDTIFAVLLFMLLFLMFSLGGNIPLILLICLILAVFLAAGHMFFSWHWKKSRFADRMLKNTSKYIPVADPEKYASAIDESLSKGVLYYGKEMIMTEDYMIGITESDLGFVPVAVPRSGIMNITFYCVHPANYRRKYVTGVLDCRMDSGKSVKFLIGQGPRMERALKILNYYGIQWKREENVYG